MRGAPSREKLRRAVTHSHAQPITSPRLGRRPHGPQTNDTCLRSQTVSSAPRTSNGSSGKGSLTPPRTPCPRGPRKSEDAHSIAQGASSKTYRITNIRLFNSTPLLETITLEKPENSPEKITYGGSTSPTPLCSAALPSSSNNPKADVDVKPSSANHDETRDPLHVS